MKTWWCIFGIIPVLEAVYTTVFPPSCPDICECDNLFTKCQNLNLSALPVGIDSNVMSLDLSLNTFKQFPVALMNFSEFKCLNLSNNKISMLGHSDFDGLESLESLDLSTNVFYDWKDIHSKTFTPLVKLTFLDLSNNPLHSIPPFSNHFPLNSLEILKLNNCSMKTIPLAAFNNLIKLNELYLADNPLSNISEPFQLKTLKYIDLSRCLLEFIKEDVFTGLPVLETLIMNDNLFLRNLACNSDSLLNLYLANCNLESIPTGNLRAVQNLYLQGNFIKTLLSGSFTHMPNLIMLNLSLNAIAVIEDGTFRNLETLRVMDLSLNKLTIVNEKVFLPTTSLEDLNLSHNYISSLDTITSTSLKRLDVSYCEIYTINKYSLSALMKLKQLSLSRNFISYLPDEWTAASLVNLDLSGCRIKSINNKTFEQMYFLRTVDLSGNRLSYIDPSFIPRTVIDIKLQDNQWRCDCPKLKKMYETLLKMNEIVDKLICDSPDKVEGMTWLDTCQREWYPFSNKKIQLWWYTVAVVIAMTALMIVVTTLRKLNSIKQKRCQELEERRRTQEREAREALQRMRLMQREYMEEESRNAPDPRESQGPPSYNDAILLPRIDSSHGSLAGSMYSLASRGSNNGSSTDINKKGKVRRKRRRRKSDSSETRRQSRVVIDESESTDTGPTQHAPLQSDF